MLTIHAVCDISWWQQCIYPMEKLIWIELKITWVTAEFVNMDLNLTNNDELFTKDCCNGEKNEELKSAFLKHYKDPSLWLITENSIHHAVDYLKTHNLPYLILKGLVNHSN